jgi:hypothetical protein
MAAAVALLQGRWPVALLEPTHRPGTGGEGGVARGRGDKTTYLRYPAAEGGG